jgi:hypothetical protein
MYSASGTIIKKKIGASGFLTIPKKEIQKIKNYI